MKKTLSILLCFLFLLPISLPCFAEEAAEEPEEVIAIRSAADFLSFSESCARDSYSVGKSFVLEANIDLTDLAFSPIPYFAGTFNGKQHTVSGFRFDADGSRQGLFRVVAEGAEITGLHVEGSVTAGGTAGDIGGIAGVNYGKISICSFRGRVSGIENVGGIVGYNHGEGVVSGCYFRGSLTGEHQAGGIAGQNDGTLASCVNLGEINTVAVTPAKTEGSLFSGTARFDISQLSEDDFLNLSNIGGIAGSSTGIVDSCRNDAPVGYRSTGYNVGGICGKSSGFVAFCRNHAEINGRRDVGGVVGQLIPFTDWDLTSGKLDALSWQISVLNNYLSGMSRNISSYSQSMLASFNRIRSNAADLTAALQNIMDVSLENDQKIIDSITIDPETGEVHFVAPSFDNADASAISTALSNMYAELGVLTDLAKNSTGTMASDIRTISGQITNVFNTLFSTVSSLGEVDPEIADLSETEAYTRNTGAIADCVNLGSVIGENNCGGILGISSFEVEFDMEDRLNVSDYLTSNARQDLFAAVRDCSSTSEIEAKGNGAGGIVGDMDIGTVIGCIFAGSVTAKSGDYVGGLVGISAGSVLNSWARSLLSGEKYVGGAAGYASKIQDCRIWTYMERQKEFAGAVAGWAEGSVRGNYYVDYSPAGVDGISISGETDPLTEGEFLSLEGIPEQFGSIQVSFRVNGTVIATQELPFGGSITKTPAVENRGGQYWVWTLPEQERLFTSVTVDGKYVAPGGTIATAEDPPRFLIEGEFYSGQTLSVEDVPPPEVIGDVRDSVRITVSGYSDTLTVRMLSPEDALLYLVEENGTLTETSYSRDGSYIVFRMPNGASVCSVGNSLRAGVQRFSSGTLLALALIPVAAVFLLIAVLRRRKRSGGKHADPEAQETPAEPNKPASAPNPAEIPDEPASTFPVPDPERGKDETEV